MAALESGSTAAAVVTMGTTAGVPAVAAPAMADSTGVIHAIGSRKCLDVPGSSTTPGTQLRIRDCLGLATQTNSTC